MKRSDIDGEAWYPYDSLKSVAHITDLLAGTGIELKELLPAGEILDIGCADGEMAFFLESIGARVTLIDQPGTNHNGYAGVNTLKQALGSAVDVQRLDIEHPFSLPNRQYSLACLPGGLHHLKNPFYVLGQRSTCLIARRGSPAPQCVGVYQAQSASRDLASELERSGIHESGTKPQRQTGTETRCTPSLFTYRACQQVRCWLNHSLPPDESDPRERGIIVSEIALE